jgi:hypothetical protein
MYHYNCELWIGKDVEGSEMVHFKVLSQTLPGIIRTWLDPRADVDTEAQSVIVVHVRNRT